MVDLTTTSPALLVVAAICVAMYALVYRELNWIRQLSAREIFPAWFPLPRRVKRNITAIRVAYFSLLGYSVVAFLAVYCLVTCTGGPDLPFDDVILWLLLVLLSLVVPFTIFHTAAKIEPPIRVRALPTHPTVGGSQQDVHSSQPCDTQGQTGPANSCGVRAVPECKQEKPAQDG